VKMGVFFSLLMVVAVTKGKQKKKVQKNDSDGSLSSNDAQGNMLT